MDDRLADKAMPAGEFAKNWPHVIVVPLYDARAALDAATATARLRRNAQLGMSVSEHFPFRRHA